MTLGGSRGYTARMFDSATSVVLAILALGLLIAVHELGHYLAARLTGMRVIRFSIGFGPALYVWTRKEIEYALSAIPLGGYVHVFGMNPTEPGADEDPRSYQRRPRWARAVVIAAGPLFSYALGVLCYFAFFYAAETVYTIAEVVPASAAATAGLQPGDQISHLDELRPPDGDAFGDYIDAHRGQAMRITLQRDGAELTLTAQLPAEPTDTGVLGVRYRVSPRVGRSQRSLGQALSASVTTTVAQSGAILVALGRLVTSPSDVEVGGPPKIVRELKESAQRGVLDFIWLIAGLTVMFGLLNVLPVPALDGSKLLILGVEAVARRSVPARFQLAIHGVGFMLLLALMVVVSVSDIWEWVAS